MIEATLEETEDTVVTPAEVNTKTQEAKEALQETKSKLREETQKVISKTRETAKNRADEVVNDTHEKVKNVENAAREAAKQLDGTQPGVITDGVYFASDRIADVAEYLEKHDSAEIAEDARTFIRKNPAVALAGAALIGLSIGRFVKAKPVQNNIQ